MSYKAGDIFPNCVRNPDLPEQQEHFNKECKLDIKTADDQCQTEVSDQMRMSGGANSSTITGVGAEVAGTGRVTRDWNQKGQALEVRTPPNMR